MESNHLMPPYRDGAHPESLAGMEPGNMEREKRIELFWPAWKAGTQPMSHTRLRYTYLHSIVKEHTSAAARGRLDPYSPDALLPDLSAVKHTGRAPRIRTGSLMIPNHAG